MFGSREEFDYFVCNQCQCLQIVKIPDDVSDYYKAGYYTSARKLTKISGIRRILWQMRRFLSTTSAYSLVDRFSHNSILTWSRITGVDINSKILDVGCGNGDLLYEFSKHGFRKLYGLDAFFEGIPPEMIHFQKTDLLKYEARSGFDLVIFNHSFEHIKEQKETLIRARDLLLPGGKIILRIPIKNQAFNIYKENWIQIDAPRHLFLHSLESINTLCDRSGLEIFKITFDSTWFQFLGSEQYSRDIAVYETGSYKFFPNSFFDANDLKKYKRKAKEANKNGLGDQAALFIRIKPGQY